MKRLLVARIRSIHMRWTQRSVVLCRLILRCSGPGRHKVNGRGQSPLCSSQPRRARVLGGRRPTAELGG